MSSWCHRWPGELLRNMTLFLIFAHCPHGMKTWLLSVCLPACTHIPETTRPNFTDVCAVCSDDIMAHTAVIRQPSCAPLSLYTSSHLMYGVVVIYRRQQHYLIGLFLQYRDSCVCLFVCLLGLWPVLDLSRLADGLPADLEIYGIDWFREIPKILLVVRDNLYINHVFRQLRCDCYIFQPRFDWGSLCCRM